LYNYSANTQYIGKRFLYLTSCHSTNDLAKRLTHQGLTSNGMVILAEHQSHGRGQQGSSWISNPQENLTFSLILKPQQLNSSNQFLFNKLLSIHLLSFFRNHFPAHAQAFHIKWPNDLYFYDQKIAGMLIENSLQADHITTSIVGIGLNVNQTSFDLPQASSLALGLKETLNRAALFNALLSYLDEYLPLIFYFSEAETKTIETLYNSILWKFRQEHRFKDARGTFTATLLGVDAQGKLLLDKAGTLESFEIKSLEFLNNTGN